MSTQTETRLQTRIDLRAQTQTLHDDMLREVGDGDLSESQKATLAAYRGQIVDLDSEIGELASVAAADRAAVERSAELRRAMAGGMPGVDTDDDGIIYRSWDAYAFDYFITRQNVAEVSKITRQWGVDEDAIAAARMRLDLVRTPANTLSSNVAGLIPPQHIAEIYQVINAKRDLVNAAQKADLERGTLTYPQVDTSPVVAAQGTQKTEAGNTGLAVSMVTRTATTYLGGGDLSWQAINWSTPNALRLWFDLVAADYALKTETDAATILSASGFLNKISSTLGATPTYAQLMTAIGAGGAAVYANSGRMADAVIMAPDRYWYALGLTSDSFLTFGGNGLLNVQGEQRTLRVIVSRGLNAGEIHVGDMAGLLVAETPGAPVEMQVVEPAIGGVEVGLIGAFEAAVVDDGAFSLITTAS